MVLTDPIAGGRAEELPPSRGAPRLFGISFLLIALHGSRAWLACAPLPSPLPVALCPVLPSSRRPPTLTPPAPTPPARASLLLLPLPLPPPPCAPSRIVRRREAIGERAEREEIARRRRPPPPSRVSSRPIVVASGGSPRADSRYGRARQPQMIHGSRVKHRYRFSCMGVRQRCSLD